MDLSYNFEQRMLQQNAVRFLAEHYGFTSRREHIKSPEGFSRTIWKKFAELGWLGLPIAESDGGFGGGIMELSIIAEAMGAALCVEPYMPTVVLGSTLLALAGSPQQRSLLAGVASGETTLAFAHNELQSYYNLAHVTATATRKGDQWVLQGTKHCVLGGDTADYLIISARIQGGATDHRGIGLFLAPSNSAGIQIDGYAMVDGRRAAELRLTDLTLESGSILGDHQDALPFIESAMDQVIAVSCADIVGSLEVLLQATGDYVGARVQFGRPLAQFQVVQHRLAEMKVMCEEARAITLLALLRQDGTEAERKRATSGAKVKVGQAARYVAQQAVQLHGGMGLTDELNVGSHLKRVTAFELLFGDTDHHIRRYQALIDDRQIHPDEGLLQAFKAPQTGMNLDFTPEDTEFRDKIRRFLKAELPAEIQLATNVNVSQAFEYSISHPWHEILHRNGMSAPDWPRDLGGSGWSAVQQYIWRMESWRAGAPTISQLGMRLVAPTLLSFGAEEQKNRFLPGILSGENYWCQGFSEPGAGSDLASLKCAATRDGDDYIVNGTKLWQTHAHFSDWMILLVRTSSSGKPQEGITCLLVDMKSQGVKVRPIITIGGDHEVNEVFLDGVRVPVRNRVGAEGEGWSIAKNLLSVERGSGGNAAARLRWNLALVMHLIEAETLRRGINPRDHDIKMKFAECAINTDAIEMLELRALQSGHSTDPDVTPSIIKLRSSVVEQAITELATHAVGESALRWHDHRPLNELDSDQALLERLAVVPRYLNTRVRTIFGGASEIQLGIIAKSLNRR